MPVQTRRAGEAVELPVSSFSIVVKEILDESVVLDVAEPNDSAGIELPQQLRHDIRNHLQAVSIGVKLLRDELAAGATDDADETFEMIQEHLQFLNAHPVFTTSESQ